METGKAVTSYVSLSSTRHVLKANERIMYIAQLEILAPKFLNDSVILIYFQASFSIWK